MSQVTEVDVGWGGGNNDFLNIYNMLKVLVFHHNELYFSVAPKAITGLLNANEVVNASQSYLLLRIPPTVPRPENTGVAALNCGHSAAKTRNNGSIASFFDAVSLYCLVQR